MAILPHSEQVTLFRQFKLDEPWDSPHNIRLFPMMPHQYESPRKNNTPGETFYQVFTGPGTAFPLAGAGSGMHPMAYSNAEQYRSPPASNKMVR